jgi:hypothetical protein
VVPITLKLFNTEEKRMPPNRQEEQQQPQPENYVLWVFELGTIGGVPFSIHYTFVLLLFLQVFAATLSYNDVTYNALMFVLYGPVLFCTVLIVSAGVSQFAYALSPDRRGIIKIAQPLLCTHSLDPTMYSTSWDMRLLHGAWEELWTASFCGLSGGSQCMVHRRVQL